MSIFTKLRRAVKYRRIKMIRSFRSQKYDAPYEQCKNCGSKLEGVYCHKCGQYALDTKQSFWKFIQQYFDNTYQFDGRFLRTFWLLFFLPGFLTEEFVKGRIVSYVHPLKMYLFCSIVFFALAFLFVPSKIRDDFDQSNQYEFSVPIDSDSLMSYKNIGVDNNLKRTFMIDTLSHDDSITLASLKDQKAFEKFADSLSEISQNKRQAKWLQDQMFYQSLVDNLRTYLPIVMLILLPLYGVSLRVFFRKRYRNYMPHFVFAVHVNIFTLLMSLIMALMFVFHVKVSTYSIATFVLLSIYIIIATKRFYRQDWIKTLIKSFLAYVLYALISIVFILTFVGIVVLVIDGEL